MAQDISTKNKIKKSQMDTSARYYPILAKKKSVSIYTFGVIMKEKVDASLLKQAANEMVKQFPSMAVSLENGYAWHCFKENTREVKIFPYDGSVLKAIDPSETNGYQFKIYYDENRIEIVFFHGLTDGTGAMAFLQALIVRYQELKGIYLEDNKNFGYTANIEYDDIEDSFKKYYKPVSLSDANLKSFIGVKPNKIKGTLIENGEHDASYYFANANSIKEKAKEYNASITGYLSGLLAYTIGKTFNSENPIVMMIPVNLRTFFPSKTTRNFVTFIRVHFDSNTCKNISDCVKEATSQLKEKIEKNNLQSIISSMVKSQKNILMRTAPLFIKKICLRIGKVLLKSRQTIIFSNLGNINLPEELGVDRYVFHLNVSANNPNNLGIVTLNGKTMFTFTRAIKETILADEFEKTLESEGIIVEK